MALAQKQIRHLPFNVCADKGMWMPGKYTEWHVMPYSHEVTFQQVINQCLPFHTPLFEEPQTMSHSRAAIASICSRRLLVLMLSDVHLQACFVLCRVPLLVCCPLVLQATPTGNRSAKILATPHSLEQPTFPLRLIPSRWGWTSKCTCRGPPSDADSSQAHSNFAPIHTHSGAN